MKLLASVRADASTRWFGNGRSRRLLLDFPANADIMSYVKVFTVRQLDREPAVVLDAANKEGVVHVRCREGRVYSIQPEASARKPITLPDFAARRRAIFPKMIPSAQVRKVDKRIRGE